MAMELFALPHLEVFYFRSEERARAVRERLEGIIAILPWIATIDAFQHWLYTHPGHSRDERRRAWLETHERFGGGVDWTGLEDPRGWLWHRQLHLFLHPFYYIEYGIAQLGALGLWGRAREDPAAALGDYKSALALGGSRPLPELFKAAGLPFDFGEEAVGPLASALQEGVRD